jgi:hypothetical protein
MPKNNKTELNNKPDKSITKNDRVQEFEYQARLMNKLIENKIEVRGNVSAVKNGKKSIFDLVVFKGDDPVFILETKNTNHKALLYGKKSKQIEKYQEYGLPILICTPLVDEDFIIRIIKKSLSKEILTKNDKRYKNMKVVY